ncbi:MAG: GntR family transcriptional regulator [Hyphomicrobiaceae bacterium]
MLKDDAYQLIKRRLFELDLVSGQFVTQRQISEMIGIPLGPVREAMLQLQAEGLVEIFPQRGIQIATVSEAMVRDLFGVRRLLEPPGIRALARGRDLGALKELRRATKEVLRKQQLGKISPLSGETFLIDQRLHELAIDALGNSLVRDFYRVQQDRLRLVRLNIRTPADPEPGLCDHLNILDAICRRDGAGAVRHLLAHLANVEKRALDALSRCALIKRMPAGPANDSSRAGAQDHPRNEKKVAA